VPIREKIMTGDDEVSNFADHFAHSRDRQTLCSFDIHLQEIDPGQPKSLGDFV
jgi:hypothetical protein